MTLLAVNLPRRQSAKPDRRTAHAALSLQVDIYVMMPISEGPNESRLAKTFRDILISVFVAKCVHVMELIYSQVYPAPSLIGYLKYRMSHLGGEGESESINLKYIITWLMASHTGIAVCARALLK